MSKDKNVWADTAEGGGPPIIDTLEFEPGKIVTDEKTGRRHWVERVKGGQLYAPATTWRNTGSTPVSMELYLDSPRPNPNFNSNLPASRDKNPQYFPPKVMRVHIKPGEEVTLPSVLDSGIQQQQCHHVNCLQNPFGCKSTEEGHEKSIVGGLGGPNLQQVHPVIRYGQSSTSSMGGAYEQIDERLLARMHRGAP